MCACVCFCAFYKDSAELYRAICTKNKGSVELYGAIRAKNKGSTELYGAIRAKTMMVQSFAGCEGHLARGMGGLVG